MLPRLRLKEIVAGLEKLYGKPAPFPTHDPWELILRENAAYLVDDATREDVFRSLRSRIGVSPDGLLGAPYERVVEAIRRGGMRPSERANKLLEAAEIARDVGPAEGGAGSTPNIARTLGRPRTTNVQMPTNAPIEPGRASLRALSRFPRESDRHASGVFSA